MYTLTFIKTLNIINFLLNTEHKIGRHWLTPYFIIVKIKYGDGNKPPYFKN
jgi:hypothetical protein